MYAVRAPSAEEANIIISCFIIVILAHAVGVSHLVAVPKSTWISSLAGYDCAGHRAAPNNHSPAKNMIGGRAETPERRRKHDDHSAAAPAEDEGFVGSYKEAEPPHVNLA